MAKIQIQDNSIYENVGKSDDKFNEDDIKLAITELLLKLADNKERYLSSITENKKKLEQFISPGKSVSKKSVSFLSILRKWNSYTPVLPQDHSHTKGGGYFLCYKGTGIVIDPGYNFVENFLNQGFKLDDIDVVIITHAHNDHTVELESIFSLLFKRNKKRIAKRQKKIDIYLNLGTFKKFAAYFDLSHKKYPNYINHIVLMDSYNEYNIPKDKLTADLTIITNKTQHHEMITCNYALGFVIKCGDKVIKFTGDTGWNNDIEKDNMKFMELKQIDTYDILIPHLGSIEAQEFDFDSSKSLDENISNKIFYNQHLGLLGSMCMLKSYRPNLVIFSEFGEELKHIRTDIIDKVAQVTGISCLAGDIGLHIDLENSTIFCNRSGKMVAASDVTAITIDGDIWYVANDSFTQGETVNMEAMIDALKRSTKKRFVDTL